MHVLRDSKNLLAVTTTGTFYLMHNDIIFVYDLKGTMKSVCMLRQELGEHSLGLGFI